MARTRKNPLDTVVDVAKKVVDVVTPEPARKAAKRAAERIDLPAPSTPPPPVREGGARARDAAGTAAKAASDVVGTAADTARDAVGAVTSRRPRPASQKRSASPQAATKRGTTASGRTAAEAPRRTATGTRSGGPSGKPYEKWTKDELYQRAQELDIEGRSTMNKRQLIEALRDTS